MKRKVLVVTHSFATGPAQELIDYLTNKVYALAFIEHPFSFSEKIHSSMIFYKEGKIVNVASSPRIKGPEFILYFKDLLYTIFFVLRAKEKFHTCFAADNLNAFSSLLLKRLRFIQKTVFYAVDYTPNRFRNRLLNHSYHLLDKICCYKCDYVWNSSEAMEIERRKRGVTKGKSAPQIVVPDGTHFDRIKRLPVDEINRFDVVFMGHLQENKGVELLIEAFPEVLKKTPKAKLIIIGGGSIEEKLREKTKVQGLDGHVSFKGYIKSHEEVESLLTHCAVAVAPYVPDPDSFSYYSDASKPKIYMAAGLPVVITRVPEIAWEIERSGAGLVVNYSIEQIADAISKLLLNDELYANCREKAIKLGSQFRWEETFKKALNEIGFNL